MLLIWTIVFNISFFFLTCLRLDTLDDPSSHEHGDRDSLMGDEVRHADTIKDREFTKGVLVKGGLAIYSFPLCHCNTLGSAFHVQIEHMPNS